MLKYKVRNNTLKGHIRDEKISFKVKYYFCTLQDYTNNIRQKGYHIFMCIPYLQAEQLNKDTFLSTLGFLPKYIQIPKIPLSRKYLPTAKINESETHEKYQDQGQSIKDMKTYDSQSLSSSQSLA